MNAFIVHNPDAGEGRVEREDLIAALEQAGYVVNYHSSEDGWEKEYEQLQATRKIDMLVACGGDGTLRNVFCKLAGEQEIPPPILIVPNGTANNLALSLGIPLDWRDVLAKLDKMVSKPFRYGTVHCGDTGEREVFFESVGIGLFSEYLRLTEDDPKAVKELSGDMEDREIIRDRYAMANFCQTLPLTSVQIEIEGHRSQAEVLWLEVLNSASMGARLRLLEKDDPQTHQGFSIVSVESFLLPQLMEWLKQERQDDVRTIGATVERAPQLQLSAKVWTYHIDDEPRVCDSETVTTLTIETAAKHLMILR